MESRKSVKAALTQGLDFEMMSLNDFDGATLFRQLVGS